MLNSSYCKSKYNGYSLMEKYFPNYGALVGIVESLSFFGVIFIATLNTILCNILVNYLPEESNMLYETISPQIFVWIFTYILCTCYTYTYHVAIDSILGCYCYDYKENEEKP